MKTHPLHSGRDAARLFTLLAAMLFVALLFVQSSKAFSLLGPYADWMSATNGYRQAGDIGGPMDINEEYRWNVPTITYGFDKSFVDYFGSNGVAAVESAIQILNDLPAASDIALNDYPVDTRRLNAVAGAQGVYDLKSTALALLIQQLGLGRPAANILDIRTWNPSLLQVSFCGDENCPALVNFPSSLIRRNFDPVTLAPSFVVNDLAYGGMFMTNYYGNSVIPFVVDPLSSPYSAVAEAFGANPGLQTGFFYTGLTRDDVGGLRYLLSATNVNWEALPKNVLFTGPQERLNKKLRGVSRPGVEKLAFVRQPQNKKGGFNALVLPYTAWFVTNGIASPQAVKQIIRQPDILFTAAEVNSGGPTPPMFLCGGTQYWINNSAKNSSPTNSGPGVIVPPEHSPIKINFDLLGDQVLTGIPYPTPYIIKGGWASFDQSTNAPVAYPLNTGQEKLSVRLSHGVLEGNIYRETANPLLRVAVPFGGAADLQISTNKTDWISLATVTNTGSVIRWVYYGTKDPIKFRVVPVTR